MKPDGDQAAAPLQVELTEQGDLLMVKVIGMAALEVSSQLSRALQEAASQRPKVLVIDLSELSFISSTGLGGLVAAHVTCERNGTQMFLLQPRPFIHEILDVTKLSRLFKICATLEETGHCA